MDAWIIDGKLPRPSDHEVIVYDWANLDDSVEGMRISQEGTGWSVKEMADKAKKEASADWYHAATGRPQMRETSSREDIKKEVE